MGTDTIVVANTQSSIMSIVKGVLWSVVLSLGLVLIYAVVVYFAEIGESVIPIVNQVIKGVSIFLGCLLSIRGSSNGWLKGAIIGMIYIVISTAIFAALTMQLELNIGTVNDIVLSGVFGIVSGIICANIKR